MRLGTDVYYITTAPQAFLYEKDGTVADEVLSGWILHRLPDESEHGSDADSRIRVQTHYGYRGYIDPAALRSIAPEDIRQRAAGEKTLVVTKRFADLLSQPRVQGQILTTLSVGSFLQLITPAEHGYLLVETADGQRGYMPASSLSERKDSDGFFLCGCDPSWFHSQKPSADPDTLRQQIVRRAEGYLGVQYRWGGHSGSGTDCSGLTFMSYLMNGILIYRDAELQDGYPVHEISWADKKPADLLYFPGHVAMYLGNGRYLHSTGFALDFGCVYGSLVEGEPGYRPDLEGKCTAVGSIFS
jgi:hypothetical protein